MAIAYPSRPQGVDFSGLERGLYALDEGLQERRARKALDPYIDWLGGMDGGQEMSLAALAPPQTRATAPQPAGDDMASQRVAQAHGDMGGDVFKRFMSTVQSGGLTNPAALAAVASTGKNESGWSAANAAGTWSDPSQSGQPGMSGGIMSWRGERLTNLQKFAQQTGDNPNAPSPETQAKFLLQENPQLIGQLQQAKTPQEAQQLMNNAWRFAGYDQPGGEAAERIADASAYMGQFGGPQSAVAGSGAPQGVQMAQGAPAGSPASMLPPAEVMRGLLRNPQTRQLGIQLAQSAQKARMGDPEERLRLEKLRLEVENLRNPQGTPTDDMREYAAAREQGFQGTLQDWILSSKKAGATNVNVGGGKYGTIPQGYELVEGPNGATMRAIPGGPEDTSKKDALAQGQADVATRVVTTAAQRARDAAKERNFGHVGQGAAAMMPWTDSAEVARQVDVLKSTAKVENLTAMRAASPTGGALGSVTEKEADMLAAKSGALDPSSPTFQRDLDDYELTLLQVVHGPEEGARIFSETRNGSAPAQRRSTPTDNRTSSGVQWSIEE